MNNKQIKTFPLIFIIFYFLKEKGKKKYCWKKFDFFLKKKEKKETQL